MRQLIIPAMFFCGIYILINKTDIVYCITDKFKCGYWFTLTLFEFILIQCLWEFIAKSLNINNKGQSYIILSVLIALGIYVLSMPTVSNRLGGLSGIVGIPMLKYYIYFMAGRLIHLNLENLLRYKYRDTLVSVVILGFLLLAVYNWYFNVELSGPLFHINLIMFELFALLSVFVFFYKKRAYLFLIVIACIKSNNFYRTKNIRHISSALFLLAERSFCFWALLCKSSGSNIRTCFLRNSYNTDYCSMSYC